MGSRGSPGSGSGPGPGTPLRRGSRARLQDRSQQLVGKDRIDHTPEDERVRIRVGEAFDVVGERVQRDGRRIGDPHEVECEITLRSHEPGDTVSIVIRRGDKVTTVRATLGTRGG